MPLPSMLMNAVIAGVEAASYAGADRIQLRLLRRRFNDLEQRLRAGVVGVVDLVAALACCAPGWGSVGPGSARAVP